MQNSAKGRRGMGVLDPIAIPIESKGRGGNGTNLFDHGSPSISWGLKSDGEKESTHTHTYIHGCGCCACEMKWQRR